MEEKYKVLDELWKTLERKGLIRTGVYSSIEKCLESGKLSLNNIRSLTSLYGTF